MVAFLRCSNEFPNQMEREYRYDLVFDKVCGIAAA